MVVFSEGFGLVLIVHFPDKTNRVICFLVIHRFILLLFIFYFIDNIHDLSRQFWVQSSKQLIANRSVILNSVVDLLNDLFLLLTHIVHP